MTVLAVAAVAVLGLAFLIAIVAIARGTDDASRATLGDMLFFTALSIFLVTGVMRRTAVLLDVALLGTLSGVLATVALARMLSRGSR
ncbi:monovalent cation/H+ antiporter complex subunit F [Nocardioides bruguierae]|uniref:monovalent cation/H+ antiporter complex subunit F n=1 Tax=Nocardioides bruguierae TaxID=2945102 RepID=UPI0020229A41|nr:monovalent cation/H+ antiporter complex subunit F [Nocardioides bruguierae]MCL8027441.1 monovalent cation/H+ antiporter complex subunit F [Nocardioides bruguierae]